MRHPKTAGPECLHRRPSSGGWRPPAPRDRRIPWGTLRTTFSPAVGGPLAAPNRVRGGFEAPLRPRPGGQKMMKSSSNRRSFKYYRPKFSLAYSKAVSSRPHSPIGLHRWGPAPRSRVSRTPSPRRHGQTFGRAGRRRSSATPTTGADRPPSRVFMRHPKTAGPECLHRRPSSGGWRPPAPRDRRIPWGTLRTTFSPAVGGPLAAPNRVRGGFEAPLRPRPGGQKMMKSSSNRRSFKYYRPKFSLAYSKAVSSRPHSPIGLHRCYKEL